MSHHTKNVMVLFLKNIKSFSFYSGSSKPTRQKWTEEEIRAVEKTLMDCISSGTVPGKAPCVQCIDTSPLALKRRSWEGLKFNVKKRIFAAKRESMKQR